MQIIGLNLAPLKSKWLFLVCGCSVLLQGWTLPDEVAFQERRRQALQQLAAASTGSIAYEYEKNSYPRAMARFLTGDANAIAFLEQLDTEAVQTEHVDLLSGFTLKVQTRKYFALPLTPAYRDRMEQAFDSVTEVDPLTQPLTPPRKFWANSHDDCLTLVDCRNTENLRTMVETSVYLMAEAAGNQTVQQQYKQKLSDRVARIYDYGLAEWNSNTYLGHTTTAWLNLYDYAQDPEVRELAQLALDYLFEAAALKYWRGTWGHPSKRYGNQSAAAKFFWLYFGEAPQPNQPEADWIHASLSDYRPSAAAMAIARRQFPKPKIVEREHANYPRTEVGFSELIYFGRDFEFAILDRESGPDWTRFGLRWWDGQTVHNFYF